MRYFFFIASYPDLNYTIYHTIYIYILCYTILHYSIYSRCPQAAKTGAHFGIQAGFGGLGLLGFGTLALVRGLGLRPDRDSGLGFRV